MDERWPIQAFLEDECADPRTYRFATPAHGAGPCAATKQLRIIGLECVDLPYVSKSIWRQSETRASAVLGTRETFYVPTGASHAVLAGLHMAFAPEATIAVSRNVHVSVIAGLTLLGAHIRWIMPQGPWFAFRATDVEKMLDDEPAISGVVISNPAYEGHASDIEAISALCRTREKRLVVDESLGSHWVCADVFPTSALRCAVDVVIHSLHKRVGALVPAALLHLPTETSIDAAFAEAVVSLFRSTSPSNLPLLDTELVVQRLAHKGQRAKALADACSRVRTRIAPLESVSSHHAPELARDPLTLHFIPRRDATDVADAAYDRGFDYEHADSRGIIYFISLEHSIEDVVNLGEELVRLSEPPDITSALEADVFSYVKPDTLMPLAKALRSASELIPANDANGRVAAQLVASCPPGIPLLIPGERVSAWHVKRLESTSIRVIK